LFKECIDNLAAFGLQFRTFEGEISRFNLQIKEDQAESEYQKELWNEETFFYKFSKDQEIVRYQFVDMRKRCNLRKNGNYCQDRLLHQLRFMTRNNYNLRKVI